MTQLEAEHNAQDWENMLNDAQCEEDNGCEGAAMKIRDEARIIEKELEAAGHNASQLLRQIAARRRGF